MAESIYIKDLAKYEGKEVKLQGWVANKRSGKGLFFIVMRDGYGYSQCVVDEKSVSPESFEAAKNLTMESSFAITGKVVKDERQMGGFEIQATSVEVISIAEEYPISKKEHGVDFLMDERHLWLRTQRQWAIMKIRNQIIFAIHRFFQGRDFVQMDAPLFTGNAVEGTSTLFETDFYGQPAYLSQSGQLYGEAMAMAMSKIYTFGPTFRAEKSKTRRHLSEFWMIEPEMAFYDLDMNMDLIEDMLRFVVLEVTEKCKAEFALVGRDMTIFSNITKPFPRLTYDEAVKILKGEQEVNGKNAVATLEGDLKAVTEKIAAVKKEIEEREVKVKDSSLKKGEIAFNQNKIDNLKNELKDLEEDERNIPIWIKSARDFRYGNDFGGSDETVITRMFDLPIMVYNWPHEVKAFYLKRDKNAPHLAKGVDVLAPEGYGEIIGGGERETDITLLKEKINEHKLPMESFEWYLDLRRYGSVKHAGFGLGLERLVAWMCQACPTCAKPFRSQECTEGCFHRIILALCLNPLIGFMIVNEVSIKNFKSLKNVRFNTKRVNVFIGEPNSGKSNLLEALSLLSLYTFDRAHLKEVIRFENTGNLFYDNDVSQIINISTGSVDLNIEYAKGQQGAILNEFWFEFNLKDKKPYPGNDWSRKHVVDYSGDNFNFQGDFFQSPFHSYFFKRLKTFKTGFAGPFLETPFGNNIPSLLLNFPHIKNLVSDFFRDKGYFLNIKPVDYSIELAKNINDVFVSYPYLTISETLQRIVFISLAIATNKDSVLLFDEPESNTFPFYTKYIAETIANDKSNQYFLTTHNPFLLMNLVEKTPTSELTIFVAKNKDYQTKLYPLTESDMQEVVNLGHDVFFNLDKFTEKE